MKSKLMLASMILLASLSASAQKIYTGSINFNNTGYSVKVDNANGPAEREKGKQAIINLVSQVYGQEALKSRLDADDNYHTIVVTTKKDALKQIDNFSKQNLKSNQLQDSSIIVYSILGAKGAASSEYGGYSLIDRKKQIAYNLYENKSIKIKM